MLAKKCSKPTFAHIMTNHNYPNFPFHPGKWPFFYGWMILIWGTVGVLMSVPGQTIGVSAFTESLIDALKVSRDQISLAYMAGTIGSAFLLPWVGKVYDRVGVRPVAFTAAVLLAINLIYLSKLDRIIRFFDASPDIVLTFICSFIGFMLLRFLGQGTLTMVSRNMMMQWFDQRRGFATGFSNVFISLGFSTSPLFLDYLIQLYNWRVAWLSLAAVIGLLFPLVVFVFFRNSPEESGLQPDGNYVMSERKKKYFFKVVKDFTLKETVRTYSFWVFTLMLAMQGLYITGFTFHVVSIFEEAGLTKDAAITIFQPTALLAVLLTLLASSLSDYIQLKYLLYLKGFGACLGIFGMIFLGKIEVAYYTLVVGNGIMMGLFSVLTSVTWPRYFGKKHLGAINGQSTMLIVFGSAIGPILFSTSLSVFGQYSIAGWICFSSFFLLTVGAMRANNPQLTLKNYRSNT